jgi:hypothetical protein
VLIEKAADLKSQADELSTTPDPAAQALDVDPETSPLLPDIRSQI